MPKHLFLHCGLASSREWGGILKRRPDIQPILVDHPDHGDGPRWDPGTDYADAAMDHAVAALPGEPVHLIGHSFGAVLALRIAVERPEAVLSLTLFEPVFFAAIRGSEALDAHDLSFAPFVAAMARGDLAEGTRAFLGIWGDDTPWERVPKDQKQKLIGRIPTVPAGLTLLRDDRTGILSPGRLERLAMPVRLIDGTESPPVIAAIAEALSARIPQLTRHRIEGAGHMLPITHAGKVAPLLP